jgi:uncharacterized protein YceK
MTYFNKKGERNMKITKRVIVLAVLLAAVVSGCGEVTVESETTSTGSASEEKFARERLMASLFV